MPVVAGEIQVLQRDEVVHVEPIGPYAIMIGRSPDNDLRLADSRVSGHHVVLRWTTSKLLVHDLGSTNGTFLNEQQVTNPAPVADGDVIRLGSSIRLRIRLRPVRQMIVPPSPKLLLADLKTGVVYPLRSNRFRVGTREDSDLRLSEGPAIAATLSLHDNGEIWVGTDEEEHPIEVGEPFQIGEHRLIIRDDRAVMGSTERETTVQRTRYPYRLKVELGGQVGPEALLEDLRGGATHSIRAENRVALLYVLAQQAVKDRERALPESERGWTQDEDAIVGIWGRRWESLGPNNYQVLLCRLRKEITDAGLDGWFIEKRSGCTRIVLDDIQVKGN